MFYISFDGNQHFQQECSELFFRFSLFDRKQKEAFEAFLSSPYFVEDPQLPSLFKLLYPAFQKSSKYTQGKKLIRKLYGASKEQQQYLPKLRASLTGLSEAVYRFITYERLKEMPADYYKLMVESALALKRIELFEPAARHWKQALSGHPTSVQYLSHQWLLHHYAYFRLNDSKTLPSRSDFQAAKLHFELLRQLVETTYANEEQSWQQVFGDAPTETETEDRGTPHLIAAYRDLLQLRRKPDYDRALLQKVLSNLSQHGQFWVLEEQFIIWQMMLNYLAVHNRLQVKDSHLQIERLLSLLMERRYYEVFRIIPRALFLNLLKMALMVTSEKNTRDIMQRLSPKLPEAERPLLQAHAQIAIAFELERYEEVLHLMQEHFPRYTMDTYHDGLRLKSYRLRSALAQIPSASVEEEYERAKTDFDKLLERKKESLAASHYDHYRAFLKNVIRIYKALNQPNSKRSKHLHKVRQQLTQEMNTHAYHWMIVFIDEKIGEQ